MKELTRRELLRASAALLAAPGLSTSAIAQLREVLDGAATAPVIWLQGQSCSGCSVSLLNSIHYTTIDNLLLNMVDLEYHSTLMAAAGEKAVSAAEQARTAGGYILVIEGSIPIGAGGQYCRVWEGTTMHDAVLAFAPAARFIMAVGSCAAFGGVVAANTNPTEARSVGQILGADSRIINVPGCPAHPDWIVGTIAYLLSNDKAPPLDLHRRPTEYYGRRVHEVCSERRTYFRQTQQAATLGDDGCLEKLGCRGKTTCADCPTRKWNSGQAGGFGVNWCIGARAPCQGCVEPDFPGMFSFFSEHHG